MQDEKDMIEINLNNPSTAVSGKGFNYFGNISLSKKSHGSGFPYGQYHNEDESAHEKDNSSFCGFQLTTASNGLPQRISCLRQMYCPDCQARLDDDSVLVGRHILCCIPIFSINRLCKSYLRRPSERRVYCKHCGADMGYLKQV